MVSGDDMGSEGEMTGVCDWQWWAEGWASLDRVVREGDNCHQQCRSNRAMILGGFQGEERRVVQRPCGWGSQKATTEQKEDTLHCSE